MPLLYDIDTVDEFQPVCWNRWHGHLDGLASTDDRGSIKAFVKIASIEAMKRKLKFGTLVQGILRFFVSRDLDWNKERDVVDGVVKINCKLELCDESKYKDKWSIL
jgi:hypothetical protein